MRMVGSILDKYAFKQKSAPLKMYCQTCAFTAHAHYGGFRLAGGFEKSHIVSTVPNHVPQKSSTMTNNYLCYKLLISLILIGSEHIFHRTLPFVIEN